MSWEHVLRRDLTSVYRTRTGTAVAAIIALFTVLVVGLMGVAANLGVVAGVGALVSVAALIVMVFVGSPRTVAAFVGAFTILTLVVTATFTNPEYPPDNRMAVLTISSALSFLLPLVGLLGSYAAIVGERSTGSIRYLLGLPNSRDEAYLGKFVSRSIVVLAPLVTGMFLAGIIVAVTFRDGSFPSIAGLGLVSIPYALLFVGIGLSASAYADTDNRAVAVVIGVFAVLRAGWPALQWLGVQGMRDPYPRPEWFFWFGRINPINAYVKLTELFAEFGYGHQLIEHPEGSTQLVATTYWFAALVLLTWTVAAPLFGLWYFRRRDLL